MAVKKRIGRPPKAKEDRKAKNFTFRGRHQMWERLQAASADSGMSISEEIERRLEDSFRTEDIYGPELSPIFRILAGRIALAKAKAVGHWAENDQIRNDIAQVLAELLAKNLPQFYSVTIETMGEHGIRGVNGYASQEIADREHPGLAEMLRARREAVASRSTHTHPKDSK
jgi:hypothetical protein